LGIAAVVRGDRGVDITVGVGRAPAAGRDDNQRQQRARIHHAPSLSATPVAAVAKPQPVGVKLAPQRTWFVQRVRSFVA